MEKPNEIFHKKMYIKIFTKTFQSNTSFFYFVIRSMINWTSTSISLLTFSNFFGYSDENNQ